ncbi:flagellar hook-associated protein 3 [Pseudarthrobacter chlorophenolicus A6]|uniref:Flagellar hook-associated protein 3 n=1 Tax=Pseudarthrobacter chlorophenolicus (strain ATCC 700700 / DSM 12829 / CIP 107037 / JCM 12360 / KCTC 9906 / NCIMB 13794 / A6) TaxID=452863 RepID=B8HEL7_PSECP|nr:flagellar hook-associated protein FlgL [Pseudarthrobacter chlorophenolicus]ACL40962.1 flagellar hook-associated protein 3 [Pseudarthrobacter chlorophenolicus A6]SDQ72170.1 flagellar hook-associated protein 3 FlgL [Pseudarthrobacter chlorophenolicus]
MLNRVTNQTMAAAAQRNLQAGQAKLASLQEKGATLQNITRPSDDPAALAAALATRGQLQAADQYSNNISDGTGWLNTADSALGQATNVLNRIRDLMLQASNGSLNQPAKDAIAAEIEGLNKDLLASANTKYLGRNVFAGNSDAAAAFTGQPPAFNGTPVSSVERRVDADRTVRVDADGGAIFGDGAGSVFALVGDVVAAIRAGADPSGRLDAVDDRLKTVISGRAEVGTRQSLLEQARDAVAAQKVTLESRRSAIEDADIGQVVLDLKLQETNYQVALAVTAKVLQPSLMDFLR